MTVRDKQCFLWYAIISVTGLSWSVSWQDNHTISAHTTSFNTLFTSYLRQPCCPKCAVCSHPSQCCIAYRYLIAIRMLCIVYRTVRCISGYTSAPVSRLNTNGFLMDGLIIGRRTFNNSCTNPEQKFFFWNSLSTTDSWQV